MKPLAVDLFCGLGGVARSLKPGALPPQAD